MVVEETLVDGQAQVPQVYHLGRLNVDVVHIDLALAFSLHSELVKNALGSLFNAEDHDLVDDLGSSSGVQVLVRNRLGDGDRFAVVVVANLGPLVMSVVVILTVVQVEVAGGVWVLMHRVRVDLEAHGIFDGLEKRLASVVEVKDGKDGSTSNERALLGVSNVHNMDVVVAVNLELRVDVVPLGLRRKVHINFGSSSKDGIFDTRVANLRAYKDVGSEHELMVQVIGHLILRELVEHRTHDRETIAGGLKEQVVHVVSLSIPLLDRGIGNTLHAR